MSSDPVKQRNVHFIEWSYFRIEIQTFFSIYQWQLKKHWSTADSINVSLTFHTLTQQEQVNKLRQNFTSTPTRFHSASFLKLLLRNHRQLSQMTADRLTCQPAAHVLSVLAGLGARSRTRPFTTCTKFSSSLSAAPSCGQTGNCRHVDPKGGQGDKRDPETQKKRLQFNLR